MCEDAWYVIEKFGKWSSYIVGLEELRAQFQDAEKSAARLTNGTDSVRETVMNTQLVFLILR